MKTHKRRLIPRAFTLIELLIVIAIIAILALIAIPNFLEAQVRAKVARVQTSMRTIATALEAYYVDFNNYPIRGYGAGELPPDMFGDRVFRFKCMSSPIAYITDCYASALDPFQIDRMGGNRKDHTFGYLNRQGYVRYTLETDPTPPDWAVMDLPFWFLASRGPDRRQGPTLIDPANNKWAEYGEIEGFFKKIHPPSDIRLIASLYDPTNGTVSNGDIVRWGP